MKAAENCSYAHDSNSCVRVSACEGYLSAPNESAVHSRVTFADELVVDGYLGAPNESVVHSRVTFCGCARCAMEWDIHNKLTVVYS